MFLNVDVTCRYRCPSIDDTCQYCSRGHQSLSTQGTNGLLGTMLDGSYSFTTSESTWVLSSRPGRSQEVPPDVLCCKRATVHEDPLVNSMMTSRWNIAAITSCGGPTGWGAVTHVADVGVGDTGVVFCAGGVRHERGSGRDTRRRNRRARHVELHVRLFQAARAEQERGSGAGWPTCSPVGRVRKPAQGISETERKGRQFRSWDDDLGRSGSPQPDHLRTARHTSTSGWRPHRATKVVEPVQSPTPCPEARSPADTNILLSSQRPAHLPVNDNCHPQ